MNKYSSYIRILGTDRDIANSIKDPVKCRIDIAICDSGSAAVRVFPERQSAIASLIICEPAEMERLANVLLAMAAAKRVVYAPFFDDDPSKPMADGATPEQHKP